MTDESTSSWDRVLTGLQALHDGHKRKTLLLLDVEETDLEKSVFQAIQILDKKGEISSDDKALVEKSLPRISHHMPSEISYGVEVVHERIRGLSKSVQILLRFSKELPICDENENPTHFLWVLFCDSATHPKMKSVAEFVHLMHDPSYRDLALQAESPEAFFELYRQGLDRDIHFPAPGSELKKITGFAEGVKSDLKRKAPQWFSDFTDGFKLKVLASTLFMFFACAAPAIAFGALTYVLTEGQIGVPETIISTALCGILWSFFGGQPLIVVGVTGPNVIFTGILYTLCKSLELPFLQAFTWVGLWAMLFLLFLSVFNASALIRFFTRFTDEIFAALISLIFIVKAVDKCVHYFTDDVTTPASALLSLLLALGTFVFALTLSRFRSTPYLRHSVREFLSDFGPTISLAGMTAVAYFTHGVEFETLSVPDTITTTVPRTWLIPFLEAKPIVIFGAAIPALFLTILIWVNQNIGARLVNSPDHKLKKGSSYHWDVAVIGVIIGISSLFGLPWVVGSVVLSLNHVRSLANIESGKITSILETRLSNLCVHLLIAGSLLVLSLLQLMPVAVLYGIFLFMGVGSLRGNQFIERLKLWFIDPEQFNPTHYLRAVPTKIIHAFTGIQLLCLAILWVVKSSAIGIIFPFLVALLVPMRMLLARFFDPEHIAILDLEETPEEEQYRELGS